ncbi:unnamed protein product [Paramecium sonneborni]|uniref:Uncharacterized protein n=1 Tax=Paramecium sonneborni TaxID=65129 RepID=A0A8S1R2L5_9CILI|nr:unnamed protein product [Paramecium sonneborni]
MGFSYVLFPLCFQAKKKGQLFSFFYLQSINGFVNVINKYAFLKSESKKINSSFISTITEQLSRIDPKYLHALCRKSNNSQFLYSAIVYNFKINQAIQANLTKHYNTQIKLQRLILITSLRYIREYQFEIQSQYNLLKAFNFYFFYYETITQKQSNIYLHLHRLMESNMMYFQRICIQFQYVKDKKHGFGDFTFKMDISIKKVIGLKLQYVEKVNSQKEKVQNGWVYIRQFKILQLKQYIFLILLLNQFYVTSCKFCAEIQQIVMKIREKKKSVDEQIDEETRNIYSEKEDMNIEQTKDFDPSQCEGA